MKLSFDIPGLKTVNPLNAREHWAVKHKRDARERLALIYHWPLGQLKNGLKSGEKAIVTLTRCGPRRLDANEAENASFKAIRDSIARRLGVDDGDSERVAFLYRQEKGEYAVRIEIEVVTP